MSLSYCGGAVIGRRSEQQDVSLMLKLGGDRHLFVVADGMGGHCGGREAAETVCLAFRHYFESNPLAPDQPKSLLAALVLANDQLAEISRCQPEMAGLGSTVLALIINECTGGFRFLSVGDSPLYQWSAGRLIRLNDDHSLREDLRHEVENGRMSFEEAAFHPDRNILKSAVVGQIIPLIDEKEGLLAAGERLILASDGMQTLDDGPQGQVAGLIGRAANPSEALDAIFAALARADDPVQDNATVLVVGRPEESASPLAVGRATCPGFKVVDSAGYSWPRRMIAARSSLMSVRGLARAAISLLIAALFTLLLWGLIR